MDGVSIAASIIAVLDVSAKVLALCSRYSKTVADARSDVSRLTSQVEALKRTLDSAKALVQSPRGVSLPTLRQVQDQFIECRPLLESLQERLERAIPRREKSRLWLRALKWPFTKEEIDASIKSLEGYRVIIWFGLQLDQTALILDIKNSVDNLPTAINEDSYAAQRLQDQSSLLLALNAMDAAKESTRTRLEEQECLRLFRLTNDSTDVTYESYKSQVEDRAPDTCQWFLNHDNFQSWLKRESGLLLVSADPGCGKSVLAKYLIEHVFPDAGAVCYFFFREQDQDTVRQALCAVLHQLFCQKPFLLQHAMPLFARDGADLINSTESLWKILHGATHDTRAGCVIIVLDALDECSKSEFAGLIRNLQDYQVRQLQNTKLRYLVTCRPYEVVISKFRGMLDTLKTVHIPGEEVSDAISLEITSVIAQKVELLGQKLLLAAHIKEHLRKKLTSISHRTYLWVSLIFDYMENEGFVRTLSGVDALMATLPPTINAAYEQILSKANQHDLVRKALSIILAARRPLTLDELNIALSIDSATQSFGDLDLEGRQDFQRRIQSITGRFVSVYHGVVYLFHQTAREFLLAGATLPLRPTQSLSWQGTLTSHQVHGVLAELCILYLKLFNANDGYIREAEVEDEITGGSDVHALLHYSAENWGMHFRESCALEDTALVSFIIEICDPASNSYQVWFDIYCRTTDIWPTDFTSLMIASHFGHVAVVEKLLQTDGDVDSNDNISRRTPLMCAAESGHVGVIELLLQHGAKLDSEATDGANALLFAASRGREAATKLLLEKGSDIESKDKDGRTALSLAAQGGHLAVLMLLIGKDADMETTDKEGRTPLIHAAARAKSDVMSYLINKGASVAATDYKRKGLLHHATVALDSTLDDIRTLISIGVDVDSSDAENMKPLHYTVRYGRTDIAKLLLQAGVPVYTVVHRQSWCQGYNEIGGLTRAPEHANIPAETGRGLTPLHYAAWVGDDEMVRFFLQHGANPNALSDYGETPIHLAVAETIKGTGYRDYWSSQDLKIEAILGWIDPFDSDEYSAAMDDILRQRLRVLDALLNHARTDVNIHDIEGESAMHKIHYAQNARFGSNELAMKLLQNNAVLSARLPDNKTPLHLACESLDADSVTLLASREQLKLRDQNGMSALHIASNTRCIVTMQAVVDACIQQRVDLSDARDNFRRNALHWYLKSDRPSTYAVQLLLDYGVDAFQIDLDGNTPFLM